MEKNNRVNSGVLCEYWQYVSRWAQVERSAECLSGGSRNSVAPSLSLTLKRVQCSHVRWCDVSGRLHLIMGDPLGLGDELSAAHFAVAVCEKPLVHLCWLHLEKETNGDMVTDLDAVCDNEISTVCFQTAWDETLCWTSGLQSEQKSRIPIIHNQGDR